MHSEISAGWRPPVSMTGGLVRAKRVRDGIQHPTTAW